MTGDEARRAALADVQELRRETRRLWAAGTVGRKLGLDRLDRIEAALQGPPAPVDRVTSAWLDHGQAPAFHQAAQKKLFRDWPTLARAVAELSVERTGRYR